ncbi:MAG TPA: DUF2330 domain-containing protein [Labilithrix sp.]|nr:DUF2330 domain-containing protein [Labilithrix sp.]
MKKPLLVCMAMAVACAVLEPAVADACGGCFTQPAPRETERTVVTDHRMALSISTQQTVLWDQIRYSGDPAEFAWVLPVRSGAKLELSNDAFFTALDSSTQPVVYSPQNFGGAYGCGLTGCSSTQAESASAGGPGAGQVQILSQAVVGPYETVTLRATDPGALRAWLKSHAFAIPDEIAPTIDAYVAESFDFLALRLRPDCGERAMQPVRIVTPGADPTLPLRMVAAGVGAKVGLTLYVISEGRYQPRNFPHGTVDRTKVRWDRVLDRSNYEALTQEIMAGAGGRTWVAEYADKPQLFTTSDPRFGGGSDPHAVVTGSGTGPNPGLADAYYAQCKAPGAITPPTSSSTAPSPSKPPDFTPCRNTPDAGIPPADAGHVDPQDAGADAADLDAGEPDAGDVDAGDEDAAADASTTPDASVPPGDDAGPTTTPPVSKGVCLYLDDLDTAMRGLHPKDVWVTRFRASLPSSALSAGDLQLEPEGTQAVVSNVYYASAYADEDRSTSSGSGSNSGRSCISAPKRRTAFGSWVFAIVCGIAAVALVRRRTRPRR